MPFSKEFPTVYHRQDVEGSGGSETERRLPIRIFVAEDDAFVTELLKASFGSVKDATIEYADSGADTLTRLRTAKDEGSAFDLLITDHGLRDGDVGVDVARRAKDEGLTSATILLTGRAIYFEGKTPEELEEMGLKKVWGKPFSPMQILREVEEFRPRPPQE